MRVALIASSLRLAGAEKQLTYIARALFEAGIDVRVFYLGPGDHYQQVLNETGIPLQQIYSLGHPWFMLARLAQRLLRFRPHITLASQFGDLIFAGPTGRLCNSVVLGGVRSDGFYELRTSGRRSGLMLRLAHGLIANSARAKANLSSQGVNPETIVVLPNVIDLEQFNREYQLPLDNLPLPNRPIIAAVGSLHPCKRFDLFLESMALARVSHPPVFGVIAGKDLGAKAHLESRARSLQLYPEHLTFTGECSRVPALLSQSRMLVLCSEYEGFPNVLLEAMAARLPVITAPAGDAALIVQDGITGFVVEKDPVKNMAARMVQLIDDRALAMKFGEAGRRRVEQEYSFDLLAGRLLKLFNQFACQCRRISLASACCESVRPPRGAAIPARSGASGFPGAI